MIRATSRRRHRATTPADVAVMRAKLEGAVVAMGSATPSLESWQNSAQGKYTRIELRDRVDEPAAA